MEPIPNLKPTDKAPFLVESNIVPAVLSEPVTGNEGISPQEQEAMTENWNRARQRANPNRSAVVQRSTGEMTEAGRAYSEKMRQINYAPEPTRLEGILQRVNQVVKPVVRPHVLPYEEATVVVNEIYRQELLRKDRQMVLTDELADALEAITRYFIGDPDGPLPLTKGLFLYGGVGVGKTFLMSVMNTLTQVVPIPLMAFATVSTKDLVRAVKDAKSLAPLAAYERGGLLLDDLGEEKNDVRLYGDSDSPMDLLLSNRYIHYTRSNQLTHATSNLDPSDIEKRYGTRIYDRFFEMFEGVLLTGESKRS